MTAQVPPWSAREWTRQGRGERLGPSLPWPQAPVLQPLGSATRGVGESFFCQESYGALVPASWSIQGVKALDEMLHASERRGATVVGCDKQRRKVRVSFSMRVSRHPVARAVSRPDGESRRDSAG